MLIKGSILYMARRLTVPSLAGYSRATHLEIYCSLHLVPRAPLIFSPRAPRGSVTPSMCYVSPTGGAIFAGGGDMLIKESIIAESTAGNGGAVFHSGQGFLAVNDTKLAGNMVGVRERSYLMSSSCSVKT